MSSSKWPSPSEYSTAIQHPSNCFDDPDLKSSSVKTSGLGLPLGASGNFAVVYQLQNGTQKFAVRCFIRPVTNQQQRYDALSQHLKEFWLSHLVDFAYLPKGIRIRGQWYPIVRMEWAAGKQMRQYVEDHLNQTNALGQLAAQWRGVMAGLNGGHIAHGDLQHGNILIDGQGNIRLVDYDGFFLLRLRSNPPDEVGHPNYQHPDRIKNGYYAKNVDAFSALVIYLSLLAIKADKTLWDAHHNDENLIFSAKDYQNAGKTPIWGKLKKSSDSQVRKLTAALEGFCRGPVSTIPTLEELIQGTPSAPSPVAPKPIPQPTPPQPVVPKPISQPAPSPSPSMDLVWSRLKLVLGPILALLLLGACGLGSWMAFRLLPPPTGEAAPIPDITVSLVPTKNTATIEPTVTPTTTPTATPTATSEPISLDPVPPPYWDNVYVEYILDASGSMQEEVDGVRKIDIAKEVLATKVSQQPATTNVGLRVYGHRIDYQDDKEASCRDIELMVPPVRGGRDLVLEKLPTLNALGMTPLSKSVIESVNDFDYNDPSRDNSLVVISDGEETCGGDPCSMADDLINVYGIDFTMYVIGLDILDNPTAQAQLKCLADKTGGVFLQANNRDELAKALDQIWDTIDERAATVLGVPSPTFTLLPANAAVPPTFTPTFTPVPYLSSSAGPTFTPTFTPVPPTFTPTFTPVPPTFTPTFTPVPPTFTPTFTPVPVQIPVRPTLVVPIESITTSSTHPGTSVNRGQTMTVEQRYAIDNSDDTGWVSNYTLEGSWVRLQLREEKQIAALRILNGGDFLDDEAAYIKTATLSFSDGSTQVIHLEDNYSIIEISPVYTDWVKIVVDEVYDNKPHARLISILDLKLYEASSTPRATTSSETPITLPDNLVEVGQELDWALGNNTNPRRVEYPFYVPADIAAFTVRVRNGGDDTGDGAVEIFVFDPQNQQLLYRVSAADGWDNFEIPSVGEGEYQLVLQDLDTASSGSSPGNGGSFEIILID